MTEQEWLETADTESMIKALKAGACTDRKCWLAVWAIIDSSEDWKNTCSTSASKSLNTLEAKIERQDLSAATGDWQESGLNNLMSLHNWRREKDPTERPGDDIPAARVATILRDIFYCPCLLPPTLHLPTLTVQGRTYASPRTREPSAPAWLTDREVWLARGVYEERRFTALPMLADALEEAGCVNEEVLQHLRSLELHWRGCWALDLILGKS